MPSNRIPTSNERWEQVRDRIRDLFAKMQDPAAAIRNAELRLARYDAPRDAAAERRMKGDLSPLPPNLRTWSLEEIRGFSTEDQLAIAIVYLAAIHETDSLEVLVPRPLEDGEALVAAVSRLVKVERFKTKRGLRFAEALLHLAETEIGGKKASHDSDEYWPASAFSKKMGARLRVAASKTRKSKRVRKKTVDGVVCYSVADVRRWWAKDLSASPRN